jgi:hypothetical protein
MAADRIVEGWQVFERWAKRFKTNAAVDERYAYCLSSTNDLSNLLGDFPSDLNPNDFEYPSDGRERIRNRIAFLRDYLVDISFDGGDFHASVKKLLACQAPRACPIGYTIWLGVNDIDAWRPQETNHFRGIDTTLFCEKFDDYDFASVMNIAPFETVFVRNRRGADWIRKDAHAFLKNLKDDLAFDGIEIDISRHYNGDEYFWGPLLAAWVKVTEPQDVYFNYSQSTSK